MAHARWFGVRRLHLRSKLRAGRPRTRPSTAPQAWAATLLLAALGLASCSDGGDEDRFSALRERPNEPTVEPLDLEAEIPDTRGVDLIGVNDFPAGPIVVDVRGGDAALEGTITGPDGPVEGARVLLERFVGDQSGSLELVSGADGTWRAGDIHGGRYRVRAWQAPRLGMTASALLFIRAGQATPLDLDLVAHDGVDLQAVLSAPSVWVGGSVTVTALATRDEVDAQGILRTIPNEGAEATALVPDGWELDGAAERTAAADGRVSWRLTCTEAGGGALGLSAAGVSQTLPLGCTVSPPTIPAPVPPPTTDFAVGEIFTPPFAGPIPAGTYRVAEHEGTCGLVYQPWANGAWSPQTVTATGTGTIRIGAIARDLRTVSGVPACSYERMS